MMERGLHFYNEWVASYTHYEGMGAGNRVVLQPFESILGTQYHHLKAQYPKIYAFFAEVFDGLQSFADGRWPKEQLHVAADPSWNFWQAQLAALQLSFEAAEADIAVDLKQFIAEPAMPLIQASAAKLTENDTMKTFMASRDLMVTVFLSVLLTPDAVPRPALGYQGARDGVVFEGYSQINQKGILPDHCGMLFPTKGMMEKIYKERLMGPHEGDRFDYFGKYR